METKLKEYLTNNQDKIDEIFTLIIDMVRPYEDVIRDLDDETMAKLGKIVAEFLVERCEVLFPDLI